MRVISGDFKGKKILEPKDIKTRPLKDLTKESIFNILKHSKKFSIKLENSEILDLFSGTGSFGIDRFQKQNYRSFAELILDYFFLHLRKHNPKFVASTYSILAD